MATTPNYGFIMPDPTDFVTDLPADFEIFGDEVDSRIKALNPETTAGDISYRGATANAKVRLPIGTAGQVLRVNSGATAPEWFTPAGGGDNFTLLSTTTLSGSSTNITGISGQNLLHLVIENAVASATNMDMYLRINSDTAANYYVNELRHTVASSYAATDYSNNWGSGTSIEWSNNGNNTAGGSAAHFMFFGCNSAGQKHFIFNGGGRGGGGSTGFKRYMGQGFWNNSATVSSFTIFPFSGTLTGTARLYGSV